jgi:excisionase family DNA binding protein
MSQLSTGLSRYGKKRAQIALSTAPLVVSALEAARMLSLGESRVYKLMRSGELQSYQDGRARRIPVTSVHEYIAKRLAASAGGWQQWPHNPISRRERQQVSRERA